MYVRFLYYAFNGIDLPRSEENFGANRYIQFDGEERTTNRSVTIKITLKFTKISNKSDKSLENRKKSALFFHEKAKNSAASFSKRQNFPTTNLPPPVTEVNFPPPEAVVFGRCVYGDAYDLVGTFVCHWLLQWLVLRVDDVEVVLRWMNAMSEEH